MAGGIAGEVAAVLVRKKCQEVRGPAAAGPEARAKWVKWKWEAGHGEVGGI